jgi:histidyl-tRNA synthetase
METETVKGFRDFVGEEALKREKIRGIITKKFRRYGFMPAETPIIEQEEFVRGENPSDEAVSTIFKLQDRGKRNLALRYEFTFQLKRISKNQKLPFRRYQIGEVFRDEPISANRFRQFTQCDVDIIGSTVRDEAEILKLTSEILAELGIDATIYINNRKLLNEILDKEDAMPKGEIIREIDKMDKLSEAEVRANLQAYGAGKLVDIFKKPEAFFKKYDSYKEIETLMDYCKEYGAKVVFMPSLARGLSYYNGSIFEIKTTKMKETIIAGGSYLVNNVQSTGISFGLNRLGVLANVEIEGIKCVIISINQDKESVKLAQALRAKSISCSVMDKISKALDYANSQKVPYAIFVGAEEIKKKKFKLRDMKTGKEKFLAMKDIAKVLMPAR